MSRIQVYAIIVAGVLASWAAVTATIPKIDPKLRIVEDFASIPKTVDGWDSRDFPMERLTMELLPTCSLLSRSYTDASGREIGMSIVYGRDIGDFHQPETCERGDGWLPAGRESVTIHPDGMPEHTVIIATLNNEDVGQEKVMLYWFYLAGGITSEMASSKTKALFDIFSNKTAQPSAMVKFVTLVDGDPDAAKKLVTDMAEKLERPIVDMIKKTPKYEPSLKAIEALPEK